MTSIPRRARLNARGLSDHSTSCVRVLKPDLEKRSGLFHARESRVEPPVCLAHQPDVLHSPRGRRILRIPGKGDSNSHGTRPVYSNHLDDEVNSDQ